MTKKTPLLNKKPTCNIAVGWHTSSLRALFRPVETISKPLTPFGIPRAFTMMEAVVVLVTVGLFSAFAYPQLTGVATMNSEQQAKTASGAALDAVVVAYGHSAASAPWQAGTGSSDVLAPPMPEVNQLVVHSRAPDVDITSSASAPSTRPTEVSVGLRRMSTSQDATPWWRVGTAALASSSAGASCWMTWRDLDAPSGYPPENYMVYDVSSETDAKMCTGKVAAYLNFEPPSASSPTQTGRSWQFPREVSAREMTDAAAAA